MNLRYKEVTCLAKVINEWLKYRTENIKSTSVSFSSWNSVTFNIDNYCTDKRTLRFIYNINTGMTGIETTMKKEVSAELDMKCFMSDFIQGRMVLENVLCDKVKRIIAKQDFDEMPVLGGYYPTFTQNKFYILNTQNDNEIEFDFRQLEGDTVGFTSDEDMFAVKMPIDMVIDILTVVKEYKTHRDRIFK